MTGSSIRIVQSKVCSWPDGLTANGTTDWGLIKDFTSAEGYSKYCDKTFNVSESGATQTGTSGNYCGYLTIDLDKDIKLSET